MQRELSDEAWAWAGLKHVVYFLHAPICGLVKIGYSFTVSRRVAEIQLMSPVKLDLLGVVSGDKTREAELHQQFAHLRSHGEWFRLDDDLREFIDASTLIPHYNRLPRALRLKVAEAVGKSNGDEIDASSLGLSVAPSSRPSVGRAA